MQVANQSKIRVLRPTIGWLIVGLPVVALLLRFAMRALGVRPDVPFPGFIYSVTAPIVEPFYRFAANNPRFDTSIVEPASLLAAGTVFLVAVFAYLIAFLLFILLKNRRT
jgi:hypothetical protein